MPRNATTRKTTARRSRWSPEQIAEWRQRDRDVMNNSTGYLEDIDTVRQFAKAAAGGRVSARILGYSLRNQMLLEAQAAALGFVLTDVKSAKEWRKFGRKVKPEWHRQGLRLVAPMDKRKKDGDPDAKPERDDDGDADDTGTEAGAEAGSEKASKPKFCTVAMFDVAQTEELPADQTPECEMCGAEAGQPCDTTCSCGACVDYQPQDDDAAETVWNNLLKQINKREYAYDWPASAAVLNSDRVRVDHDARTVYAAKNATADDPDAVADLAAALADIIARADRAKAAQRTARAALTAA